MKPEYKRLYNSKQWKQLRLQTFLRDEYQCAICGKPVKDWYKHPHAAVCDHITPHKGEASLFYDPSNLQTVGKSCHDGHKQSIEKGGKGRLVIGVDGWPVE